LSWEASRRLRGEVKGERRVVLESLPASREDEKGKEGEKLWGEGKTKKTGD